jgi:hypothetical protein
MTSVPQMLNRSAPVACAASSVAMGGASCMAPEPLSLAGTVRPPLDADVVGVSVKCSAFHKSNAPPLPPSRSRNDWLVRCKTALLALPYSNGCSVNLAHPSASGYAQSHLFAPNLVRELFIRRYRLVCRRRWLVDGFGMTHEGSEKMCRNVLRWLSLVAVATVLAMILVACSSNGGDKSAGESQASGSTSSSAASAAMPSSATSASESASGGSSAPSSSSQALQTADWDRKIIRNAQIDLQVNNVATMLATIRGITDGAQGLVFASSTSFDGDNQLATITLDVPAGQFDQVINSLRSANGVKKVQRESVTSQDVTDEYVDLTSRLKSLNASHDRLLDLIKQATSINDIVTLDDHLSDIEAQIDQTTGRINYLDKKTSFSRIVVTLSPVAIVTHENGGGFDLVRAAQDAWASSLNFTGDVLTAAVKVVVFLWWLLPLAAIAYAVITVRRRQRSDATAASE